MRVTPESDITKAEFEEAKQTALAMTGNTTLNTNATNIFFSTDLKEVETGIRKLNEFSNNAWILSSLLLYTVVYNNELYRQSGLAWKDYTAQSRQRLGMNKRDITEQLSAARFFIKNHKALVASGYKNNCSRKLARAELATELCGSVDTTIKHLSEDTWLDFKDWYQSFKPEKEGKCIRADIDASSLTIGGIKAVTVSEEIKEDDRIKLSTYLTEIFSAMSKGLEPVVVSAPDKEEAGKILRAFKKDN